MTDKEICTALKITPAMLDQLRSYVWDVEREGTYYGNKGYYINRDKKIRNALNMEARDE